MFQSRVGHGGVREVEVVEVLQPREVDEPRVGDVGVGEVELAEATQRGEVGEARVADLGLAELEDRDVTVSVAGNRVTIDGRVRSWRARQVVEDAAWSVAGVTEVTDQLIVG